METTTLIRIGAGVLALIILGVILYRRGKSVA